MPLKNREIHSAQGGRSYCCLHVIPSTSFRLKVHSTCTEKSPVYNNDVSTIKKISLCPNRADNIRPYRDCSYIGVIRMGFLRSLRSVEMTTQTRGISPCGYVATLVEMTLEKDVFEQSYNFINHIQTKRKISPAANGSRLGGEGGC